MDKENPEEMLFITHLDLPCYNQELFCGYRVYPRQNGVFQTWLSMAKPHDTFFISQRRDLLEAIAKYGDGGIAKIQARGYIFTQDLPEYSFPERINPDQPKDKSLKFSGVELRNPADMPLGAARKRMLDDIGDLAERRCFMQAKGVTKWIKEAQSYEFKGYRSVKQ